MENTKLYIAYGSNMAVRQMAYRCPNAKLVGTGYLNGYRLAFHLHATVERDHSANSSSRVPVAVWTIDPQDEKNLDRYEGVPSYYTRHTRTVEMQDGSQIKGLIYLMKLKRKAPPTTTYVHGILEAYRELGFEREVETVLMPAVKDSYHHYANTAIK